MPKNKGKGGKNRRRGKNEDITQRELTFKEHGTEYGQVQKTLGNGRFEIRGQDDKTRIGHVRGTMNKKVWIAAGDVVLMSLRDYQDGKCDIILKYMPDEIKLLKAYGELTDKLNLEGMDDLGVEFDAPGAADTSDKDDSDDDSDESDDDSPSQDPVNRNKKKPISGPSTSGPKVAKEPPLVFGSKKSEEDSD